MDEVNKKSRACPPGEDDRLECDTSESTYSESMVEIPKRNAADKGIEDIFEAVEDIFTDSSERANDRT